MVAETTTDLVAWDKVLADAALESAGRVAGLGGGQFFSIRGGKLSLGDQKIPDNTITAIVLDSVFENVFYGVDYDPDAPASPKCYSFDHDQASMAPHEAAPEPVCATCRDCENNKFGSADRGKGKACKNRIRLALIAAGTGLGAKYEAFDDAALKSQAIAYLSVPPTSINAWGTYVKQVADGLKRPPYGVETLIALVPDDKTQVRLTFTARENVHHGLMTTVVARHKEAVGGIVFPYPVREVAPPKPSKKRKF